MTPAEEAFEEGKAAMQAREPRSSNPHDGPARNLDLGLAWLRGWLSVYDPKQGLPAGEASTPAAASGEDGV